MLQPQLYFLNSFCCYQKLSPLSSCFFERNWQQKWVLVVINIDTSSWNNSETDEQNQTCTFLTSPPKFGRSSFSLFVTYNIFDAQENECSLSVSHFSLQLYLSEFFKSKSEEVFTFTYVFRYLILQMQLPKIAHTLLLL